MMDSYHDLCHMISVAFHELHVDDNRNDIIFWQYASVCVVLFFHDKRNKIKLQKKECADKSQNKKMETFCDRTSMDEIIGK